MRLPRLAALALVVPAILATGCAWRDGNRWGADQPRPGLFPVVVAPAGLSASAAALAALDPQVGVDLAAALANRVDFLGPDADGLIGEALPPGDAAVWSAPVPAAQGAGWVVLLTVDAIEPVRSAGGPSVQAVVTLRVVEPDGTEVLRRTSRGTAPDAPSPKFTTVEAQPAYLATRAALFAAAEPLLDALRVRRDRLILPATAPARPAPAAPKTPAAATGPDGALTTPAAAAAQAAADARDAAAPPIAFTIGSTPAGADVLVDGVFKGTTPLAVTLPVRSQTVRIELQGYQPGAWCP